MGTLYITTFCNECGSQNVISKYDEEFCNILCCCMDCYNRGTLKNFDYILEGDIEE